MSCTNEEIGSTANWASSARGKGGLPSLTSEEFSRLGKNPVQRAGLCRGEQLLLRFFGEGSRQLKLNPASLAKQVAESACPLFSVWCSSACRSTCKLRDLKSPAPIPDPSLFCACQV